MTIANAVVSTLTDHHVAYDVVAHPKSYSSQETANAAHVREDHIAKGVLLKDKKGYLLTVIPASHWVDLHRLRDELGRNLELAPEDDVGRLFSDCDPGAVPPIGTAYDVETVLDESLTSLANVYFEAGDHERLIRVTHDQFHELMQGARHGHFSDES